MRFATLGPKGSCHENALIQYLAYHGIENYEIIFFQNFHDGLEMVRANETEFLVQCSAHSEVHLITEKYFADIKVIDTFIYPTKELVLLENAEVLHPKTLGLVKATEGYLSDDTQYPDIIYEISKPVVGKGLLEGKYDAGLTHIEYYNEHPGKFRLRKSIGAVLTTWIVYGRRSIFNGSVIGALPVGFFQTSEVGR